MASKRSGVDDDRDKGRPKNREKCFFGKKCYRRNPCHFLDFSHPHLHVFTEDSVKNETQIVQDQWRIITELGIQTNQEEMASDEASKRPKKKEREAKASAKDLEETKMHGSSRPDANSQNDRETGARPKSNAKDVHLVVKKLSECGLMSFFFTKVRDVPATHKSPDSIFLTDLLHPAHGNLQSTLQVNFLVEFEWLMMSYEATGNDKIPLLLLHGEDCPDLNPDKLPSNVEAVRVRSPYPFGTHHTKLMVLIYDDGSVRVVVSTANLIASDWENRTQMLWVGPKCPSVSDDNKTTSDSKTAFKTDLLAYLDTYNLSLLDTYMQAIKKADFSRVNAFFVASAPGSHTGANLNKFGHTKVAKVMHQHRIDHSCSWPLVMQCSSIGSLGKNPEAWAMSELAGSLGPGASDVMVSYPSKKNVFRSVEGVVGGGCLPYRKEVHAKQPWLQDYLHQWKSEKWNRTKAMPHVKTYTQIDGNKARFVLLTSANLSKAAWGTLNKAKDRLYIMSYEAGVLLLPEFVKRGDNDNMYFDVDNDGLVLPFDVPLVKYDDDDTPWFMNHLEDYMRDQSF